MHWPIHTVPTVIARSLFTAFCSFGYLGFSSQSAHAATANATSGQSVTFSVTANGTAPFSYQWRKDNASIAGAASSTYIINALVLGDTGVYSVVVSNSGGSTTSDLATLTVTPAGVAPTITAQPNAQSISVGDSASFTVAASGSGVLAYQWRKNGVNIAGAVSATFTIVNTTNADAAIYSVVVANAFGSSTSIAVNLTVNALPVAPSITTQPTGGSVTVGQSASFTVTATGSGTLSYQWKKNSVNLSAATSATFTIGSAATTDTGSYSVMVTNAVGSATSSTVSLQVTPPPTTASIADPAPSGKVVNISTRSYVGTGDNVQIAGFIIGGTAPKGLLIRASGPALTQYGVTGVLADPVITLFSGSTQIYSNDDWGTDAAAVSAATTIAGATPFAQGSKDAAIAVTVQPGAYTAMVSGKNGTTGVALIEVFEAGGAPSNARLVNISTRSQVLTSDQVQIAGFIISGSAAKKVLIRASGPALTQYNVPGVLTDPILTLYSGSTQIAQNNDWGTDAVNITSATSSSGAVPFAPGSKDAAIAITLQPGAYSAIVNDNNGGTGIALIEVFELD